MANRNPTPDPGGTVEQAMNRVLRAERDARQAVRDCEGEARKMMQEAQQRAQRIASLADERISLMHMRCEQWLSREIRALETRARDDTQVDANLHLDQATIKVIVDDMAARLTGGEGSVADAEDVVE